MQRGLMLLLLFSWQAALLTTTEAHRGTVAVLTSIAVGITLILLRVMDEDPISRPPPEEEISLERIGFFMSMH
jgi:hypothetical protein